MQLRRFQGPTMNEAYERVREALGDDAVIVSTRSASVPGVLGGGGVQFVEVVAGLPNGESDQTLPIGLDSDIAAHELVRGIAEASASGIEDPAADDSLMDPGIDVAGTAAEAPPFTNALAGAWRRRDPFDLWNDGAAPASTETAPDSEPATAEPGAGLQAPAAGTLEPAMHAAVAAGGQALLASIAEQLTTVRDAVESLTADRAHARVEAGPEPLRELRTRLTEQGLPPAVQIPLLDQVASAIVPDASRLQVLQTAERKLAVLLPPVPQLDLGRSPLAIFVAGPGGSGKTSLAVRLAADLAGKRGAQVALASIDVNRAGAPQQITACAAAAGLPVRLCYAPGELRAFLAEGAYDAIVVDTPGQNGTRRERLTELNAFLQAASHRALLLTLPATSKTPDLLALTTALAPFGVTALVPTRIDETAGFGGIAGAAIEARLGVAYMTQGDSITEGLRAGDNHELAAAVLAGRWPQPAAAARRSPARAG